MHIGVESGCDACLGISSTTTTKTWTGRAASSTRRRASPVYDVVPLGPEHVEQVRRLHASLLPVRCTTQFYADAVHKWAPHGLSWVALAARRRQQQRGRVRREQAARARTDAAADDDDVEEGEHAGPPRVSSASTRVVGAVCARDLDRQRTVYIDTLCVDPLHRERGIGTQLLAALDRGSAREDGAVVDAEEQEQEQEMALHVHVANEEAIRFYHARGFEIDGGRVPDFYRRLDPPHAYRMRRRRQRSSSP